MELFTSKEEKLILRCIKAKVKVKEIRLLLMDHGVTHTLDSIARKIISLQEEQAVIQAEKKKQSINRNLISYRTSTLYYAAKKRAANKNIEFTLTKDWIKTKLEKGVCERTGLKFKLTKYGEGKYKTNSYAPSLDKIDPSKGYTPDNVQVTINNYNKFKSDSTDAEVIKIARALVKNHYQKYSLQIQ